MPITFIALYLPAALPNSTDEKQPSSTLNASSPPGTGCGWIVPESATPLKAPWKAERLCNRGVTEMQRMWNRNGTELERSMLRHSGLFLTFLPAFSNLSLPCPAGGPARSEEHT